MPTLMLGRPCVWSMQLWLPVYVIRQCHVDLRGLTSSWFDIIYFPSQLNTLKNEELKIYLRANALQLGGSKNVMIERILKHMGY
jgi:hypothetical protein